MRLIEQEAPEQSYPLAGAGRASALTLAHPRRAWRLILFFLSASVAVFLLAWPFFHVVQSNQHYVFLARSFAHGSLEVDNLPPDYRDFVPWQGHKYLPFGPLPALLLVPFLPLLDAGMLALWVGYLLAALNVFLLYRVLTLAGIEGERRGWALLLFFGGTASLGVTLVGISTYFAHIVVTTFLLLAMWEMLGARRLPLAGLFLGFAGMARFTAIFALPFFLRLIGKGRRSREPRVRIASHRRDSIPTLLLKSGTLAAWLAVPVLLLCVYNTLRFGKPLETGFGLAVLYDPVLEQARSAGLFSVDHVPKNLFMFLLQGPQPYGGDAAAVLQFPYVEPSMWGMGIFFASPALLYIFRARLREPLAQACWLAVVCVLLPIVTYYGIGFVQFGYRYALDFMPFLLILAGMGLPRPMTARARLLVIASVLINIWGSIFLSLWL